MNGGTIYVLVVWEDDWELFGPFESKEDAALVANDSLGFADWWVIDTREATMPLLRPTT